MLRTEGVRETWVEKKDRDLNGKCGKQQAKREEKAEIERDLREKNLLEG